MFRTRTRSPRARAATGGFAAGLVATLALLAPLPASAQLVLDPDHSFRIRPEHTTCSAVSDLEATLVPTARAEALCPADSRSGVAHVFASSGVTIREVTGFGQVKFVTRLRVGEPPTSDGPSRVPISIRVPVDWDAGLANSYPLAALNRVVGDFNVYLALFEAPAGDPGQRGELIARTQIVGASHGGSSGCLSLPTGLVGVATGIASCARGVLLRERGNVLASLEGVAEVGRVYTVELVTRADVDHRPTPATGPLSGVDSGSWIDRASSWREMVISLGTDPRAVTADLQEQIDELQRQVDELREEFRTHVHTYRTGKGAGHNNTAATSSPPVDR